MTQPFARNICWKPSRIGEVINKEALSVNRADFLATHVPMREIIYERAPREMRTTSEHDLLHELFQRADSDQHTFVILKGVPGTGKSHLIRWLKERYAVERPQDMVILIERANTSLRGTLQQIINSGAFEVADLPNSLQRLQEAVTELSAEALADNLIDQIKTGTREIQYDGLPNRLRREKVEAFLLDRVIREQLKAPGGALERITTFLSQGRKDNIGIEESPGFEPADFEYTPDVLRRLMGYPEAKAVADDLQHKQDLRETLARYLNHLLRNYAITRATRLSTQDLREMFNELRAHLRGKGLQLSLFVEDITAFTGIDEGLLDVLITQHKGEANAAYCRLTSVIGVTDAYFSDYMPDNIKQRATHQLTLSSRSRQGESDLLQSEDVRREFVARYLNAMRFDRAELDQWVRAGASSEALPNACEACPFRISCHAAFGSIPVDGTDGTSAIGLYPFNESAIDALFLNLRDGYARTPRTFLFDILAYVLLSHGDKIELGSFPAPEADLAPSVRPPAFSPPAHRQLVESQAGAASSRFVTLLLFWGNRSAARRGDLLGGLPEGVFQAFSLKPIPGSGNMETSDPVPATIDNTIASQPAPRSDEQERLSGLIDEWMRTGKLSSYDRFAEWMADLIRSHIDWQAHGISLTQVKTYITQGRFEIEGQSGTMQRKERLFFQRTPQLRYVLQALVDLNVKGYSVGPEQYGEHLATLSVWIRSEESRIVSFVREPSGSNPSKGILLNTLARNAIFLACIEGQCTTSDDTFQIYQQVIDCCARNDGWQELVQRCHDRSYPRAWNVLVREANLQKAVSQTRVALLSLLNRPQGSSEKVLYVNAAALLTVIDDLKASDWAVSDIADAPETNDPYWSAATTVQKAIKDHFRTAVGACFDDLMGEMTKIRDLHGEGDIGTMLQSMQDTLSALRNSTIAYNPILDALFSNQDGNPVWTEKRVDELLKRVDNALDLKELRERAIYASTSYVTDASDLRNWHKILKDYQKEMQRKCEELDKKLENLRSKTDAAEAAQSALMTYVDAIDLASTIAGAADA